MVGWSVNAGTLGGAGRRGRIMKKILAVLVATFAGLLAVTAAPAHAAPYGFEFLLAGAVKPGGDDQLHVENFAVGSTVTVDLVSGPAAASTWKAETRVTLGTFTADADGVVDTLITIPADTAIGQYHVEATGTAADGSARSVSFNLEVSLTATGLPSTGTNSGRMLGFAAGLVALGLVFVGGARIRRRSVVA